MSDIPILKFNNKTHSAVAMTGNIAGVSVELFSALNIAVHSIVTGTPTGTLIIEGSNDNSTFTTITSHALAGAATSFMDLYVAGYCYIQARYAFTSGTGTLTVTISGK